MTIALLLALMIAATAATGLLAGASLDQSIKQLPSRHRIGAVAYSNYSRAADLGNGILWYGVLGVAAALLSIAAAIAAHSYGAASATAAPIYVGAVLAVLHSAVTAKAAPTNFRQRRAASDQARLTAIFNQFEKWQTIRCILQVANFGVMLWALAAIRR